METSMRDIVSDILLVGDGETILQDAKARLKELVETVVGKSPRHCRPLWAYPVSWNDESEYPGRGPAI